MNKQTKGLLALAVVGVAAYFILRPKNTKNCCGKVNATGSGVAYKYQLLQDYMAFPVQQCGRVASTRGYKLKTGDIIIASAYSCWNGNATDGTQIHTTIPGLSGDVLIPTNVLRLIST